MSAAVQKLTIRNFTVFFLQLPSRDENYKCLSVSYNADNRACVYLAEIARPLNRKGAALRQDKRYNYYAKMCVSADTVSKCRGYVTRFTGKELVGMNDAKLSTASYPDCVKACLKAEDKLGFRCLSGMFYNNVSVDLFVELYHIFRKSILGDHRQLHTQLRRSL